jgi:hypothetical protein
MRSAAAVLKAPIMMPLACAQISESGAPDILHDIDLASRRWRGGHDAAVAETRQLDLCAAVCSRVVLGPLAVAARRLFAAAQINSLHGLDAARLAELQGLDLGMDCREEQRCN